MNRPRITIGMPAYNAGAFLRLAVQSILDQTFEDWELIIIDDGSTDNSIQSISDIVDERIIVIRDGSNTGIAQRLNQAVALAKGEYFARMDADDIALPRRFAVQYDFLRKRPSLDLVACRVSKIGIDGSVVGELPYKLTHDEICKRPWLGFYFAHPTWLGRTDWFKKHPYSSAPIFCEDQDVLLRSYKTSKFETVNEVLLQYRVSSNIKLIKRLITNYSLFHTFTKRFIEGKQYGLVVLAFFVLVLRLVKSIALFLFPLRNF